MNQSIQKTRGHNQVWISGRVGGKIVSGETRDGDSAFSFGIHSESGDQHVTLVRVNAYGDVADLCSENISKG